MKKLRNFFSEYLDPAYENLNTDDEDLEELPED